MVVTGFMVIIVIMVIRTDRTTRTHVTDRKDKLERTDRADRSDFPGKLCRASFAILAMVFWWLPLASR